MRNDLWITDRNTTGCRYPKVSWRFVNTTFEDEDEGGVWSVGGMTLKRESRITRRRNFISCTVCVDHNSHSDWKRLNPSRRCETNAAERLSHPSQGLRKRDWFLCSVQQFSSCFAVNYREQEDKQCRHNVTLSRVHETIVAVEKQ